MSGQPLGLVGAPDAGCLPIPLVRHRFGFMEDFYISSLQRLLRRGILRTDMRVLVVCGGDYDRDSLHQCGFTDVTISNLDTRMRGDEFAPFEWSFQDAEDLRYGDEEFDFVIVHNGLHHCASPHRGLLEMYRLAREGIVVFEPRNSLMVRIGVLLNFGQEYEVSAVNAHNFQYGGVKNTAIPNYVYRWTENEIHQTIHCFAPWARHQILYLYGLRVPWPRLRRLRSKLWLGAVYATLPLLRLITWMFPRQSNGFAFVVLKPKIPDDLHPWLTVRDGSVTVNESWFQQRYR